MKELTPAAGPLTRIRDAILVAIALALAAFLARSAAAADAPTPGAVVVDAVRD